MAEKTYDADVEAEVRSYWLNVYSPFLRDELAKRAGGDPEAAYEVYAEEARPRVQRRLRGVTQHFASGEFDVLIDELTCHGCGWRGPAKPHYEIHRDVITVDCPECDATAVIIALPTFTQTDDPAPITE